MVGCSPLRSSLECAFNSLGWQLRLDFRMLMSIVSVLLSHAHVMSNCNDIML